MHCARNAWRKKAMARLCATHAAFGGDNAGRAAMPALSAQSLDLFREEVDHDVSNSVPRAVDSATAIRAAAAAHAALLPAPEDSSAIEVVLGLLAGREQPSASAEPASALEEPAYGQEQEQEQEQEEEQEQEQEQEQQKE